MRAFRRSSRSRAAGVSAADWLVLSRSEALWHDEHLKQREAPRPWASEESQHAV